MLMWGKKGQGQKLMVSLTSDLICATTLLKPIPLNGKNPLKSVSNLQPCWWRLLIRSWPLRLEIII